MFNFPFSLKLIPTVVVYTIAVQDKIINWHFIILSPNIENVENSVVYWSWKPN